MELHLSQRQIAKLLDVNAVTVSRWESGVYPVPEGLARLGFEVIARRRQVDALMAELTRRGRPVR